MTDKDTAEGLLRKARNRMSQEDYVGTCSCNRKPKDTVELRRKNCPCFAEHMELIDNIDAYLATVAPTDTNEERKE